MEKLEGRLAVVTGAASGIGRATAVALAEARADLVLVDIDHEGLQGTRALVERAGRRASSYHVDVADRHRMRELAEEVERNHGGAQIVVNNAGVAVAARFEQCTLEDFEWLFNINFWGVVHGYKFFLPQLLRAEEGHIVNISSVFGLMGMPLNSAYCSSKFAVRGLSETLRAELVDTRVGVTSVHPGGVATNIVKKARFHEPEGMDGLRDRTIGAFERMMPPERAAQLILRGIRKNSARVLITREAHAIDAAKRVFPVWSSALMARHWEKLMARLSS